MPLRRGSIHGLGKADPGTGVLVQDLPEARRRRAGGGAAFKSSAVTVTGEIRDYESVADSGNQMHRKFCPVCGTQLFSQAESRPNLVFIRAGALDDPEIAKPSSTIWVSSAPSWACSTTS